MRNGDTLTIDLAKAKSHEVGMAIIHTLGLQSIALPEEIDKEFYDKLMEMDEDPDKKKAYARVLSDEATQKEGDAEIGAAIRMAILLLTMAGRMESASRIEIWP